MKKTILILLTTLFLFNCNQKTALPIIEEENTKQFLNRRVTPIMGWSSWNNFRVDIDEKKIMAQADFMVSTGMKDVGYTYVNIDDGFWGGRDAKGRIKAHPGKFPSGMKAVSDYIHSKGLKAGIYAEVGVNTCGSHWDNDSIAVGMGLYGYEKADITQLLEEWNYDFLKVDYCGAYWMGLDEQTQYTKIGRIIREVRPEAVYNICRWEFPGKWAIPVADSWRISGDIDNTFESILKIIDINADLWRYSSAGHFNDMDMLQVGRGMTYEEDKAHFSMWCMMNSPLLAGNDLRYMSQETIDILTNKEVIALNQDPFCYQARRLKADGDLEIWAKPLRSSMSGEVAVALLNRSDEESTMVLKLDSVGIDASKGYTIRDLWTKKDFEKTKKDNMVFNIPPHGVTVLKVKGVAKPFNVFQYDGAHADLFNKNN